MKRIAIITGASSGMGVNFARELAKESALIAAGKVKGKNGLKASDEIWLLARRTDRLEETKALIQKDAELSPLKDRYPAVRCVTIDIGGSDGAHRVKELLDREKAEQKAGLAISVLVNNAGFGTYGEFGSTDTDREMEMVDVNCTALTGITGYALPYMERGSRIINTASLASFMPLGNFAVYGASKAYVLSFSVALAAELKDRGISVTALCPGPVSTEFANEASKGAREKVRHGLSPEKTVGQCIKDSRKGKMYSMWAFKWRFKARASTFVPRTAGAWFTFRFCKRPSN